jgi:hypothetical protein
MSHPSDTALFTTAAGVIGGVGKAISAKPLLLEITFSGLTNVIIYAAASAAAGYVVKKIMDACYRKLSHFFNKKYPHENE